MPPPIEIINSAVGQGAKPSGGMAPPGQNPAMPQPTTDSADPPINLASIAREVGRWNRLLNTGADGRLNRSR